LDKEEKARQRAAVIVAVRSGKITAVEGAIRLGVSRKTYYEWEKRGLEGLVKALQDEETGRPEATPDPEKEELKGKVQDLERQVEAAKQTDLVRRVLAQFEERVKAKENRKKNG
jgi:transposase